MYAKTFLKCPEEGSWVVRVRVHEDASVEHLGYECENDGQAIDVEAIASFLPPALAEEWRRNAADLGLAESA
jgi:hypothetical protein